MNKTGSTLQTKLEAMLNGIPLAELPLDYIETSFFNDLYSDEGILGDGAFGIVLRVKEINSTVTYAMKVIHDFL